MSRYDALRDELRRLANRPTTMSFEQIAELLPAGLPASAYNHAAWWANQEHGPQAAAWTAAGYRTADLNLTARRVTFEPLHADAATTPAVTAPAPPGRGQPRRSAESGAPSEQARRSNQPPAARGYDLRPALDELRRHRKVFHSEADFQHALAWAAHGLDPQLRVRLETHPAPNIRLDLHLSRPDLGQNLAVELKYLTTAWHGDSDGEEFHLKNHAAQDIAGYDVIKDIVRVEQLVRENPGWSGMVIALSNDPSYWRAPATVRETNAAAFRLHQGTVLNGRRAWGPRTGGTMKGRESVLELTGSYTCRWTPYSALPGKGGELRWLILPISSQSRVSGG